MAKLPYLQRLLRNGRGVFAGRSREILKMPGIEGRCRNRASEPLMINSCP